MLIIVYVPVTKKETLYYRERAQNTIQNQKHLNLNMLSIQINLGENARHIRATFTKVIAFNVNKIMSHDVFSKLGNKNYVLSLG